MPLSVVAHRGAVADADADADPDTDMEGPIIVICAEGKSVERGPAPLRTDATQNFLIATHSPPLGTLKNAISPLMPEQCYRVEYEQ